MYSTISDAWNNNPINQINNKLRNDSFNDHTSHANIFNLSSKQKLNRQTCTTDLIGASDTSINLLSEADMKSDTNYASFSPINLRRKSNRFSDFDSDSDSLDIPDSRCTYSVRHLSKCARCYKQLNKLIDKKVNAKISDIILDDRLKNLQNKPVAEPIQPNQNQLILSGISDIWKETLILIIGAVIAIFLIYLASRAFTRH